MEKPTLGQVWVWAKRWAHHFGIAQVVSSYRCLDAKDEHFMGWKGRNMTLFVGCWLLVVIGLVAQKSDGVGFDSAGLSSCKKNSLPISPTKITFQALHKGDGSQQPKVMRWIPATQIHGCWSCYVLGHLAEQKRTGERSMDV